MSTYTKPKSGAENVRPLLVYPVFPEAKLPLTLIQQVQDRWAVAISGFERVCDARDGGTPSSLPITVKVLCKKLPQDLTGPALTTGDQGLVCDVSNKTRKKRKTGLGTRVNRKPSDLCEGL